MRNIAITWFDLLLVVVLAAGVLRGRKRGMSEELLDVLQWLCIVVVGALLYASFGQTISDATRMGLAYGYVTAYLFIALLFKLLFTTIKRSVGEKLVHSDTFGRLEYYMGMLAGALRFFCVLLFCLSFLHVKYISDAERAATAKMQKDNFGSISFPTIGSLQQTVFYESESGKFIRKHLRAQLMDPVQNNRASGDTLGKWRQRSVEEVLK